MSKKGKTVIVLLALVTIAALVYSVITPPHNGQYYTLERFLEYHELLEEEAIRVAKEVQNMDSENYYGYFELPEELRIFSDRPEAKYTLSPEGIFVHFHIRPLNQQPMDFYEVLFDTQIPYTGHCDWFDEKEEIPETYGWGMQLDSWNIFKNRKYIDAPEKWPR